MHRGWVKLWRKIENSAVWTDELLRLWLHCVIQANHAEKQIVIPRLATPILIKRSQFVTGRYALHRALYPKKRKSNVHSSTTWRRLKTLEKLGNLHIETHRRYTIVTVNQYDTYNSEPGQDAQEDAQQTHNRRTTDAQQTHNRLKKKEEKVTKEKKEENVTKNVKNEEKYVLSDDAGEIDLLEAEKKFIERWNITPGVKGNRGSSLLPSRQVCFRERMKDEDWRDSIESALAKFPLKSFESGNWKPNMDWILRPNSMTKILEGHYDWSKSDGKPNQTGAGHPVRPSSRVHSRKWGPDGVIQEDDPRGDEGTEHSG